MNDIQAILTEYPCDGECKFRAGLSNVTLVYYMPIYDKNGVNTNPDRNITTTNYYCINCLKQYTVASQYGTETKISLIE